MENTNLSEEAKQILDLSVEIEELEKEIDKQNGKLISLELRLDKLKYQRNAKLNYLNTDNN